MKKLLITGFQPFGGETVNPSWEAVKALPDRIGAYTVVKMEVPVVFEKAGQMVIRAAREHEADAVLCVGQAGGRACVTPERVALNIRLAGIPDNEGFQPQGEPVAADGPDGIFTTAPVDAMAAAIRETGLPGAVSNTAGTYVCNDLIYMLLHRFAGTDVRCGFIHVPFLPQQAGDKQPSMALEEIVRALTAAVQAM